MTDQTPKISISTDSATTVVDWIKNRGGVMSWKSINMSNLGVEFLTPATTDTGEPSTKPNWQVANEPAVIATKLEEVEVIVYEEVKRFHVATRRSTNGLSIKVSDGGTRRIWQALEKAGDGARYDFDYSDYNNTVIMKPTHTLTLAEWTECALTDKGGA